MRTKKTSRTRDLKNKHRAIIAGLHLKGCNQYDIADEVGISRAQVGYDLKVIRRWWLMSSIRDFETAKAIELNKLDMLERESWEAWERSKGDKETKTEDLIPGNNSENKPQISRINVKNETHLW